MKFLIAAFITLLLSSIAIADCTTDEGEYNGETFTEIKTDVPKFLEGATIIVRLKDGKESTVPAEKFKVVPRQQQFIVSKVVRHKVTTCETVVVKDGGKKNRISGVLGKGPRNGLSKTVNGTTTAVENQYGVTGGAMYQRQTDLKLFDLPVSIGVQIQENATGLGVIGLDF